MPEPAEAAPSRPSRWKLLGSLLEGFGPLIVFYLFEHAWGLVPAIVSGIVVGAALVVWQIVKEHRISALTALMAASVAIFGALDLRYQTGFFVKLEPALGNGAIGVFLVAVCALRRSLFASLAARQLGRPLADWQRRMLSRMELVWGLFFLARAGGFVWMAYHLTIDQEMFWRATAGNASYGVLIGAQVLYARHLRRAHATRAR